MALISVSGKISSGKDTVGKIIQYLSLCDTYPNIWGDEDHSFDFYCNGDHTWASDWEIKKFADNLKECVSIITGVIKKDLEKTEVKDSLVGEQWGAWTYRKFMQSFGTEVVRQIHPDVWVNSLFANYTDDQFWIITDTRFCNELQAVKDRGGITIRLTRHLDVNNPTVAEHPSETDLDNAQFDWVVNNNGSIGDLIEQIKLILKTEGLIK